MTQITSQALQKVGGKTAEKMTARKLTRTVLT